MLLFEHCTLLVVHAPNNGVWLHLDHVHEDFHAIRGIAKFLRRDTKLLDLRFAPAHRLARLVENRGDVLQFGDRLVLAVDEGGAQFAPVAGELLHFYHGA